MCCKHIKTSKAGQPPKVNDKFAPRACRTLQTYTFILWGVTAVSACFFFNTTLRCQTVSVIDRSIDLRWVCHRSVLSIRVNAGIPLQNTPPTPAGKTN